MDIAKFIDAVLYEDLRNEGDHSAKSCIPPDAAGRARLLVKDNGILAGVQVACEIFKRVDSNLQVEIMLGDGTAVKKGAIAFIVKGSKRSILTAERTALNFMQRMSGIATLTNRYVQAVAGTHAKVLDTRKTTPNFRYFEKLAVKLGGGHNHRMGLYDMIMIKDNHHDFCGGIANAIKQTRKYLADNQLDIKVELEVRNLDELREAMDCGGVDRVMFDNFTPQLTRQAVKIVNGGMETESSGGITLETIRPYAETGVDYISVGALTHSYKSMDLSLKAF